jgi:hypothetical protein
VLDHVCGSGVGWNPPAFVQLIKAAGDFRRHAFGTSDMETQKKRQAQRAKKKHKKKEFGLDQSN